MCRPSSGISYHPSVGNFKTAEYHYGVSMAKVDFPDLQVVEQFTCPISRWLCFSAEQKALR
jgi:hypothetical protein